MHKWVQITEYGNVSFGGGYFKCENTGIVRHVITTADVYRCNHEFEPMESNTVDNGTRFINWNGQWFKCKHCGCYKYDNTKLIHPCKDWEIMDNGLHADDGQFVSTQSVIIGCVLAPILLPLLFAGLLCLTMKSLMS